MRKDELAADRQLKWINHLYQRPDLAHLRPWLRKQARLVVNIQDSRIDGWEDGGEARWGSYAVFRDGKA